MAERGFTPNQDGSVDITIEDKPVRFVKESDLLAVKSLSYIAGLLDGEGSIFTKTFSRSKGRTYNYLRVTITNTNRDCLELASMVCGGEVQKKTYQYEDRVSRNNFYWIEWCGTKAMEVLKNLLPFLVVKREQALVAVRFQGIVELHGKSTKALEPWEVEVRDILHNKLRELNHPNNKRRNVK